MTTHDIRATITASVTKWLLVLEVQRDGRWQPTHGFCGDWRKDKAGIFSTGGSTIPVPDIVEMIQRGELTPKRNGYVYATSWRTGKQRLRAYVLTTQEGK